MNIISVHHLDDTYEVMQSDGTILWVPLDVANKDYQRVLAWVAAGGVVS